MTERRQIGKQFSFSTIGHIEKKKSAKATTTNIVLSRAEARRLIAAVNNTLICDPDARRIKIVGFDMADGTTHCTVYAD